MVGIDGILLLAYCHLIDLKRDFECNQKQQMFRLHVTCQKMKNQNKTQAIIIGKTIVIITQSRMKKGKKHDGTKSQKPMRPNPNK